MAEPFLAELRLMSFVFPPKGWALCNGQLLPINQNQALFSLLGTTYGGDGRVNFALPDLRGRVPIHFNGSYTLGERGGQEAHTLSQQEMPQHFHIMQASNQQANQATLVTSPGSTPNILAAVTGNQYAPPATLTTLTPDSVTNVGGGQAHENRQPYLVLSYCIALQGIFPSRN
jgi:microcystin-dependent protein